MKKGENMRSEKECMSNREENTAKRDRNGRRSQVNEAEKKKVQFVLKKQEMQ